MIVTVYNEKGGVGKSSLARSIAIDLDYYLLGNDTNTDTKGYSKAKIVGNALELVEDADVVYDVSKTLDGSLNKRLIEIFEGSDIILVPTFLDKNSFIGTMNTLKTLKELNIANILMIVNRYNSINDRQADKIKEEYVTILEKIHATGTRVKAISLNESKVIHNISYSGRSILQECDKSALSRYTTREFSEQYKAILREILNAGKEK